jgi:aromatic ring-opening dioxygenase catalytic subunit (LigB family)
LLRLWLCVQDFQRWLLAAATKSPAERQQLLSDWSAAPGARNAHPREEHLLPLMVVAGAAHGGSSSSSSDGTGHALWDGECLGAAVAGIGFGGFAG